MDELFELLTPQQTRNARPAPVALFGEPCRRRIVDFES
jgi:predicted Rossmann-fold nucleotide-binding protein